MFSCPRHVSITAVVGLAVGLVLMPCNSTLAQPAGTAGNPQTSAASSVPLVTSVPGEPTTIPPPLEATLAALESEVAQLRDSQGSAPRSEPFSGVIKTILTFVGFGGGLAGLVWIKKQVSTGVQRLVTNEFNRVNPGAVPIYVCDDLPKRDTLFDMLKRMGFENRKPFAKLSELTSLAGCYVIPFSATPDGKPGTSPDEAPFVEFLKSRSPRETEVGFVIFTPSSVRGSDKVTDAFPTITYANSIATIGTNVLTIARSLVPHFAKKDT